MADLIGYTLNGRYRIAELIGRGGMADVYKAWDQERAVWLAVKMLRDDLAHDQVFIRRFKREGQNLAKLQHPNIVRFYGLEQDGMYVYLLMDYIEGSTLREAIFKQNGKPFNLLEVLEYLRPVCSALHFAHRLGIAHCDVKPANIMLHKNGTVYLSDFGIARMTEGATTMTMAGAGTPAYMAPEQARGEDPTPQTDIYALGIVLYEMLTGGERPFTGEQARVTGTTGEKLRWEQLNIQPISPCKYNPDLSPTLEAVVMRCLKKELGRRYAGAVELLNELEHVAGGIHKNLSESNGNIIIDKPEDVPQYDQEKNKIEPKKILTIKGWHYVLGVSILITVCIASVMLINTMFGKLIASTPATEIPITEIYTPAEPTAVPATEVPAAPVNPNLADMTFIGDPNTVFDLNGYYKSVGVEANTTVKEPGLAQVVDDMTTAMPKAKEKYTIGFSVYYTVDEVGSMILETMKAAAEEAGVELLVNDANYDQNAQNQAIEQWILQGVDGVILAPCDFTGVKTALDALEKANIPVVTLNPPLAGTTYSVIMADCVEQGKIAGELLEKAMLASGKEMKGSVVYQTLPFVHPNAATRALGFKNVFTKYPDIKIIELTGISPEDHYTAFDGAIKANPDMIGAWGLYSSATIGMMNAAKANNSNVLLSSVDQDKPILAGIYNGTVVGTAAYSSIAPAKWCMSNMVNLLNGVPIPGVIFIQNMGITKDNVEAAFEHYYPGKTLADYLAGKVQ